jgi:hypothetical protein
MAETIARAGYEGRIGLQADLAAGHFYDRQEKLFRGLWSPAPSPGRR